MKLILKDFEYFKREIVMFTALDLAAEALDISKRTIIRINVKSPQSDVEFHSDFSSKIREVYSIRGIIYKRYVDKQHVIMVSLHMRFLEERPDYHLSIRWLNKWKHQIGFKFSSSNNRKYLMNLANIAMKRTHFLRE